jgi:hypothetical protein
VDEYTFVVLAKLRAGCLRPSHASGVVQVLGSAPEACPEPHRYHTAPGLRLALQTPWREQS